MISPACKGCKYRSQDKTFPCCDYYTLTGKHRGCPPGADCTKKIMGNRKRRSWNQTASKKGVAVA